MTRAAIAAHGGASSPGDLSPKVATAVEAGRAVLEEGGDALAIALAVTRHLEDEPSFNAGTGSEIRLHSEVIEMDASVMTSTGRAGAVATLREVRYPIEVAAMLLDHPLNILAGRGATRFARAAGIPVFDPICPESLARLADAKDRLARGDLEPYEEGWREQANDTVGAVVRDRDGFMVTACSTGGTSLMLEGRIGDVPIFGSGVFAGPRAAIGATGVGEEIMLRVSSKAIYDAIATGLSAEDACSREVAAFPITSPVGFIAVDTRGMAVVANRDMAKATYSE